MKFDNKKIFETALAQSAIDCGCSAEDFLSDENKIFISKKDERARAYLPLPFECDLVSYGYNIVAQTSERAFDDVKDYINKYQTEHCFETPNMNVLNDKLLKYGLKVCFMAEYFLPDVTKVQKFSCDYETKVLFKEDFKELYKPEWGNALCEARKEKDVIGVGAYDGEKLIALAGASADCDTMYQIGIDVLPEYRRRGIGVALISRLTEEIFALGKVPFYCAAWSNIKSVKSALKCGYRPAWVELTARDMDFVDKMNESAL